ncbi:MAG: UDP-N-acetylglucosamine 2-epimerase (non-hydrolyzing) [Rhodobacteraceae bacterium]|nr:UDP-N-acetylglucosamine 2-epimerase (non-hydrolyzing) [Paracoccaceae bacterium]
MTLRVLCVLGTRPEAIKMAPVIRTLRADPRFDVRVLATAQHREMLDQVLTTFGIVPDADLDVMRPGQGLGALTARLVEGLDAAIAREAPDAVLAQGDTTSVLATALAAFYRGVPFGHVEAGLRTGDLSAPFPEELNRVLVAPMARWHFAPTEGAAAALLAEGIAPDRVHVTGNTVIDALLQAPAPADPAAAAPFAPRQILATLHRRENFGPPLARILEAIAGLLEEHPDCGVLLPVHPNPAVGPAIRDRLGGHPRVRLVAPLGYADFVAAMRASYLILTDSGGVQEEAPALGVPVLVLRETTERPEAVAAGVARLVGTRPAAIRAAAGSLLRDPRARARMITGRSPYGDGRAAGRIAAILAAA